MEAVVILAALVALDVLAFFFGADSREGFLGGRGAGGGPGGRPEAGRVWWVAAGGEVSGGAGIPTPPRVARSIRTGLRPGMAPGRAGWPAGSECAAVEAPAPW